MRPSGRAIDQLRAVSLQADVSKHAEGSCFARFGDTHVLCTASVEDRPPPWLRGTGKGWVTAEYGMLPRSTTTRNRREAAAGKQGGRTVEIQRLIGRSLRASIDLHKLGERQITVDCDVIQADGGTRTAAITGGFVALWRCCAALKRSGAITEWPVLEHVAAISCGIYEGTPVLDLDYPEDSAAMADGNFVLTESGKVVEAQASAEGATFSRDELNTLLGLAEKGVGELIAMQKAALGVQT